MDQIQRNGFGFFLECRVSDLFLLTDSRMVVALAWVIHVGLVPCFSFIGEGEGVVF